MKSRRVFWIGLVIITIILLGIAVSCGDGNTEAKLTSITIAGVTPERIPLPITNSVWKNEDAFMDAFGKTDEETGILVHTANAVLESTADMQNAKITVKVSGGASVAYGVMSGILQPESFSSSSTRNFATGQVLVVRVTSEDGGSINFYRFAILAKSADAQLSTLSIAGMAATSLGNAGTSWGGIMVAGSLSLSNAQKTNAVIVGTTMIPTATIEYAVGLTGAAPNFTANDTYTFNDNDNLYVRVTSENGQVTRFYRIVIEIGRDSTLASILIGDVNATLGNGRAAWGNGSFTATERGSYQADERMPAGGFEVIITTNDEEATFEWFGGHPISGSGSTTEPTSYTAGTASFTYAFPPDQSDFIIKVTAANGTTIRYYRIRVITKSHATVYKGTPDLGAEEGGFIDPIWNAEEWLDVSRFNRAETWEPFFESSPHTTAKVKVLWDDDGLWAYWDIDFMDYTIGTDNHVRTATLSGAPVAPGTSPSGAHERDTVELFINERFQARKTANWGSQYRVAADNVWLSGDAGNPPTGVNPITIFQTQKMTRAWIKMDGAKEIGYVVIMRAPWIYKQDEQANLVFDADGKVIPGAEIGMELQVNACSDRGGGSARDAILTWNGITSQAYQNVASFGIIKLLE